MQQRMHLPTLAWNLGAFAVAAGFAVHELHSAWKVNWAMVAIVVLSCALLQGAVGEWMSSRGPRPEDGRADDAAPDWTSTGPATAESGVPDAMAEGLHRAESGRPSEIAEGLQQVETGVPVLDGWQALEHSVLTPGQSRLMGRLFGCLGVVSLGVYAARDLQSSLWLCALVLLWVALGYASHSFDRVPLLAEWITVFPGMVACTLGTYFVLSDGWEPIIAWGAALHALLSVAWLMQMHLRDVVAKEGKRTTVAWVAQRFGLQATRHVPAAYFLFAAFLGTLATLQVAHVFVLTVVCSLLGAISSWNTRLESVEKITEQYQKMIVMTMAHGVMVALWVAWT